VGEGSVVDVGVEVWAVLESDGIGGDPASELWVVIAESEGDEVGIGIGPFAGVTPGVVDCGLCEGVVLWTKNLFFSEGGVAILFDDFSFGVEEA
jgi:hypothetical protein